MKAVVVALTATVLASVGSLGQNTLFYFANRVVPEVDARFVLCTDPPGTSSVTGPEYHIELLVGFPGAPLDQFVTPVYSSAFRFRTNAPAAYGYLDSSPVTVFVPDTFFGVVSVRVRAFKGSSWDTATYRYEGFFSVLTDVPPGPGYYVELGTRPLVLCAPPEGSPLNMWITRGRLGGPIFGIAYGDGLFVAVGRAGVLTSPDGLNWTARAVPTTNDLRRVAWGNGLFVAVGNGGTIVASSDGISWSRQETGWTQDLVSVAPGAGRFVAIGGTLILTSTDGKQWKPHDDSHDAFVPLANALYAVAFGNDNFVIAAIGNRFLRSPDGLSWSFVDGFPPYYLPEDLVFGNGRFVGVSSGITPVTFSSTDAIHWNAYPLNGCTVTLKGVAYGGGRFVAVSDEPGYTAWSANGVNWTCEESPASVLNSPLYGIAYGNQQFVAVGQEGPMVRSVDGVQWERITQDRDELLTSVAYGNGIFVVGGAANGDLAQGRAILTSFNGVDWGEARPVSVAEGSTVLETLPVTGLAYGENRFVAVQLMDSSGFAGEYSFNGSDWYASSLSSPAGAAVTYGKGIFVSVGPGGFGGKLAVSTDGLAWQSLPDPTTNVLSGITFGNGQFVAAGEYGTILRSTNGVNWQRAPSGTDHDLNRVGYGAGRFLATGKGGILLVSDTGVNWSSVASGTTRDLYGIAYGNSTYVAVGTQGTILSSTDTVNWFPRPSGTANDLFGIGYGNDTFLAVGAHGTILQSGTKPFSLRITGLRVHRGGVELHLQGEQGRSFRVETSTNLVDWVELSNIFLPEAGVLLLDGNPPKLPQKFYRAVAP